MSLVSGSKVFAAHGCNPQSSSLMKMPRYFTDGGLLVNVPEPTTNVSRCVGATSAHQTQGDTPIASESENTPKAVPRRSLPAITSPVRTPGKGSVTVATTND